MSPHKLHQTFTCKYDKMPKLITKYHGQQFPTVPTSISNIVQLPYFKVLPEVCHIHTSRPVKFVPIYIYIYI